MTDQEIAKRFLAGETMEQIAAHVGVSRERIRQRLARGGITGCMGGAKVSLQARRASKVEKAKAKCISRFGCTPEQNRTIPKPARFAFREQRRNANNRGIVWEFTLWAWWCVWRDSGHWEERGRNRGQYVMARNLDEGPYAPGNVSIITTSENARYSRAGTHKERGRDIGIWVASSGRGFRATHRRKYIGTFKTMDAAAAARDAWVTLNSHPVN